MKMGVHNIRAKKKIIFTYKTIAYDISIPIIYDIYRIDKILYIQ